MVNITPRSLATALIVPEEGDYHQCCICFMCRKQTRGTGYTNLVEHLHRCHAETYVDEFRTIQRNEGSLDAFAKGNDFSRNLYHWLGLIIMENRELNMCEKVKTRKYTNLNLVSVKTFKKHMIGVEIVVQGRIKACVKDRKIGFAVDAWAEDGTHFVAVIGITEADKYLLCLSTLSDESKMGSDTIIELFDDVLDTYEIDIVQLCFFVCDHASVNVVIAKKTKVPMIGCASHRFNLAVQALMREHKELLDKVHDLMAKLNTIQNRHRLRELEALIPVFSNVTRWSSTFDMLDRYFLIYSKLDRVEDRLADFIPSARENVRLKALYDDLKNLESVSKKLQSTSVSLLDARALPDHVIKHNPAMATQLSPTASLVKFPDFENAIVKVLAGKIYSLTRAERCAVAKLLGSAPYGALDADELAVTLSKKRSFVDEALSGEVQDAVRHDLRWVPPTSNDVERLFARAGIIFTRLR